jgi:hypothetical protein
MHRNEARLQDVALYDDRGRRSRSACAFGARDSEQQHQQGHDA